MPGPLLAAQNLPPNPLTGQPMAPNVADTAGLMGPFGVAAVLPEEIPKLKALGQALVQKMKQSGAWNPDVAQALEYAQQRYPRVFGHLTTFSNAPPPGDAGVMYPLPIAPPSTREAGFQNLIDRGVINPDRGLYTNFALNKGPRNLGAMAIHPSLSGSDAATTVGHELLHAADNITIPNFLEKYNFSNTLPGGYDTNSWEIRARNFGDKFAGDARRAALDIATKKNLALGDPTKLIP